MIRSVWSPLLLIFLIQLFSTFSFADYTFPLMFYPAIDSSGSDIPATLEKKNGQWKLLLKSPASVSGKSVSELPIGEPEMIPLFLLTMLSEDSVIELPEHRSELYKFSRLIYHLNDGRLAARFEGVLNPKGETFLVEPKWGPVSLSLWLPDLATPENRATFTISNLQDGRVQNLLKRRQSDIIDSEIICRDLAAHFFGSKVGYPMPGEVKALP